MEKKINVIDIFKDFNINAKGAQPNVEMKIPLQESFLIFAYTEHLHSF